MDLLISTIDASGCAFVKMAQWASMRPDIFSPEVVERTKKLQSFTSPHSMKHTREEIKNTLGVELEEIFTSLILPIASGSIAQVHRATEESGEYVAVKVRHPNVLIQTFVDTSLMFDIVDFTKLNVLP